ncbi:protein-glutamate O-methyltransferase CheR [Oscillospiraceae bacterium MB08-C2-2]|nr:protein-glutamate O-methyltransferase CheR [Oscillospiraceae bacterium MB08-C2-2]
MIKLTDQEFITLVNFIKSNYGINLINKRVLLEGRLGNYLIERGILSYSDYLKLLENDTTGKEVGILLTRVTTNHTYFMREAEHFAYFKNTVLPQLESRITDRDLRLWCAASSTGEEPYTLAMILEDYFGASPGWNKQMLASDISSKVIELAQAGVYHADSLKELPASWKTKYFTKIDESSFQITPKLRKEVVFRLNNLMEPFRFKRPFHAIFCRNVMIYFDAPTKADLVNRMYDILVPGGYLFIGHTESVAKPTRFNYIMPSVYQKGV